MSKKILGAVVTLAIVATVLVGGSVAKAQTVDCSNIGAMLTAFGITDAAKVAQAKVAFGCGVATPAATTCSASFTRNLTVGSTGADVTALQTKLSVSPATGYFGAITKAAVVAYQTANGISATGYVGPLTLAKLNYCAPVVTPVVTPVTPVTPVVSGLEGSAGDLTSVKTFTSAIEKTVAEDASKNVLGAELTASADSDLAITSMKISLVKATGASASTRLDRYVSSVSVMQGSKEVASVDAADFTKSSTGNIY